MEERREPPAEPGSHPPIASGDSPLTPAEAHELYKAHATREKCPRCSDIDRGRCDEGEQLWRTWADACDEAYQRLKHTPH